LTQFYKETEMPYYRTHFERLNFGVSPALKQTADVMFHTDLTDVADIDAMAWEAMREQNPHWNNPAGPACLANGWSSVMGGNAIERMDSDTVLSLAWHCGLAGWLMPDETTLTMDPDLAGRFSPLQVLALNKKYPGERSPAVQALLVLEVYGTAGNKQTRATLQIVHESFVLWGYGPQGTGAVHIEKAGVKIQGHYLPFELPDASGTLPLPQVYETRTCYGWRFIQAHVADSWKLADSEASALQAAQESAIAQMRQSGHRHCCSFFATKQYVSNTADANVSK
jgi:hypothetical protein